MRQASLRELWDMTTVLCDAPNFLLGVVQLAGDLQTQTNTIIKRTVILKKKWLQGLLFYSTR